MRRVYVLPDDGEIISVKCSAAVGGALRVVVNGVEITGGHFNSEAVERLRVALAALNRGAVCIEKVTAQGEGVN